MADRKATGRDALDFAWRVHAYMNEYIRFADQKAAVVLAIQTAVIGGLYSAKAHQACWPARASWAGATAADTLLGLLTAGAFLGLFAGCGCALWAITPRLRSQFTRAVRDRLVNAIARPPVGDIYWRSVLSYGKADYVKRLQTLDPDEALQAVAVHIHVLASVADAKFGSITFSVAFGAFGSALAFAVLFTG